MKKFFLICTMLCFLVIAGLLAYITDNIKFPIESRKENTLIFDEDEKLYFEEIETYYQKEFEGINENKKQIIVYDQNSDIVYQSEKRDSFYEDIDLLMSFEDIDYYVTSEVNLIY